MDWNLLFCFWFCSYISLQFGRWVERNGGPCRAFKKLWVGW